MALLERSDAYGELQKVVDYLFRDAPRFVRRLDVLLAAEIYDIHPDLRSICELLPPGSFTRDSLCTQLNSSIAGHAWGYVYGTVE